MVKIEYKSQKAVILEFRRRAKNNKLCIVDLDKELYLAFRKFFPNLPLINFLRRLKINQKKYTKKRLLSTFKKIWITELDDEPLSISEIREVAPHLLTPLLKNFHTLLNISKATGIPYDPPKKPGYINDMIGFLIEKYQDNPYIRVRDFRELAKEKFGRTSTFCRQPLRHLIYLRQLGILEPVGNDYKFTENATEIYKELKEKSNKSKK
jgi:hypothetical protein